MNELDLIKKICAQLPNNSYIGDDTAFLDELGIVVTTDTLVEDIHFRLKTISAFDLGKKSLAVNLSDIASDGAIPVYAFVSLSLPKYIDEIFVKEFYDGMKELCEQHNVIIAGGDITGAEKFFVNITLIAKMNGLLPARRNNAKVGDVVFATGFLGSSRAGLEILEKENLFKENISEEILEKFKKAHRNPFPYVELGRKIVENSQAVPAMMDTSDGLADALFKIAQKSQVEMEIFKNLIPTDVDLEKIASLAGVNILDWILFGGEDYTLVGCVEEKTFEKLLAFNLPLQKVGYVSNLNKSGLVRIKKESSVFEITEQTLINKAFKHF